MTLLMVLIFFRSRFAGIKERFNLPESHREYATLFYHRRCIQIIVLLVYRQQRTSTVTVVRPLRFGSFPFPVRWRKRGFHVDERSGEENYYWTIGMENKREGRNGTRGKREKIEILMTFPFDFLLISSEYYAHYYFLPIDRMSIVQYQSLRLLRLTMFRYSHMDMCFYSRYTRNIKSNAHNNAIRRYRISLAYKI